MLARAAALIFAFTAVSRVLGFLREAVFAATFGASGELDAFFVAQGPQNIVVTLVSTAVVTSAIPVLAAYVSDGDGERARATFDAVFTLVLAVLIAAAGTMAIFAEPIVRLTAPGFDEEQVELAARLARILLAAAALVAATNLLSGLLQAHRRFLWPAVVGIPFNVAMIGAALLLAGDLGAVALALGFVLGSAARVGVLTPGLREIRFRPALRFDLGDPGLRRILALAPLVLIGHSVANVNLVVDRLVGSTQVEGTISALNYGFRLVTLPHGLIALALIQAAYPALGSASGAEDRAAFRELMRRSLGTLALLLVPVAAAALVLREPVVELVYGRGSFDAEDAALTADAVAFYALGLFALGWRELVTRAFYAYGDGRTPVLIAVVAMAVNVTGDVTLGRAYGVAGLAGSTSLSLAVALVLSVVALERRFGAADSRALAGLAARVIAAAAPAAAAMWVVLGALRDAFPGAELLLVAGPALAGAAVYLAAVRLLAPSELRELTAALRSIAARPRPG